MSDLLLIATRNYFKHTFLELAAGTEQPNNNNNPNSQYLNMDYVSNHMCQVLSFTPPPR